MLVSPARSFVLSNSFTMVLVVHCYFVRFISLLFHSVGLPRFVLALWLLAILFEEDIVFAVSLKRTNILMLFTFDSFGTLLIFVLSYSFLPKCSLSSSEKLSENQPTTTSSFS